MQKLDGRNPGAHSDTESKFSNKDAVRDSHLALAPRDRDFILTPKGLQTILEWAGLRLEAISVGKIKPSEPGIIWPEYSQDKFQVLEFRGSNPSRSSGPSSAEIPIMDEILLLPNLCSDPLSRRIIHRRLLIHPISGRYKFRWDEVAQDLEIKISSAKFKHKRGLEEVIKRADKKNVCRLAAFVHR